jgi:D-serine deaminase-like pyridoxal phosphate-dependent protein
MDLAWISDQAIDWRYKGIPLRQAPVPLAAVRDQGWNALEDLVFPVMLLKQSALEHNISLMADYCHEHGLELAPHGKTTMCPQIFKRQLDAGAWGITAATPAQVRAFRAFGVSRILLANQLLEPQALEWVASELASDSSFDFFCLVDSLDGVGLMEQALEPVRPQRKIKVLVELGIPGGRTGSRPLEAAKSLAGAVVESSCLELAGVEGYEGIITAETMDETIAAVDRFLRRIRDLTVNLEGAGLFEGLDEVVITAGGSAFFDRVAEHLAGDWLRVPVRLVLRCGCYATHDSLMYEDLSPLAGRGPGIDRLSPALEIWGRVLSHPEPKLAIAGFGKRDVSHDVDLPLPRVLRTRSGDFVEVGGAVAVFALNDQHAYLRLDTKDVVVGDLLGCGISHPCTAFDKWRLIPVVDDDYNVVDAYMTFF